jgi:hypothetical protein
MPHSLLAQGQRHYFSQNYVRFSSDVYFTSHIQDWSSEAGVSLCSGAIVSAEYKAPTFLPWQPTFSGRQFQVAGTLRRLSKQRINRRIWVSHGRAYEVSWVAAPSLERGWHLGAKKKILHQPPGSKRKHKKGAKTGQAPTLPYIQLQLSSSPRLLEGYYLGGGGIPCNRQWRPIGLWDVKDLTMSRQSAHRWRWGCQPYAPAVLYSTFLLEAV